MFLHTLPLNLCVVRVHAFVARKYRCCRAKIYHFGSQRRQCSQCKRTWRIRKKRPGRKRHRMRAGALKAVFVDARTLKTLTQRYGLTPQGLSWRFRGDLRQFTSRSRNFRLPKGPLVLVLDGLYFRFRRKDSGFVCDGDQTLPSKSSHLPRSGAAQRQREHAGLVPRLHNHSVFNHNVFRASVSDEVSGIISSVQPRAGSFSSAIFISSVDCRTAAADAITDCMQERCARGALPTDPPRLELPDGRRLRFTVLTQLRHRVAQAKRLRVMRMIVRESFSDGSIISEPIGNIQN